MTAARFSFLILMSFSWMGCDHQKQVDRAIAEGVLLVGNSAEPKALDHHLVTGVPENRIITALFEGLATDHVENDAESPPGAAESWTHNAASTDWTFSLRRNGRWSDGEPVTAHDFVFAYHRLLHPDLAAYYADMLYVIEGAEDYNRNRRSKILLAAGMVEGVDAGSFPEWIGLPVPEDAPRLVTEDLKEAPERASTLAAKGLDALTREELAWLREKPVERCLLPDDVDEVAIRALLDALAANHGEDLWDLAGVGVVAQDDYTLRVKLRESVPYLPSLSCHYTWFPIPRHVVLRHGKISDRFTPWSRHPNLVGNGPFKLKSWRFHDVIEVERNEHYWDADHVRLRGIRFHPIENSYSETRAFLAGQLHTIYTLPSDLMASIRKNHPDDLREEPWIGTVFVRFNTERKGLDDARVRNALALAIDREMIVKHISEGHAIADSISPVMGNYRPEPVLAFDPSKARALLAEAGYPDGRGFPRHSMMISRSTTRPMAEAFQAMWSEHLNISITIENRDWGSYNSAQQNLQFDMALAGWIGDYLDPTTFLNMWTQGNGNNNTGWHSVRYEALLREAATKGDAMERYAVLRQAESIFMNDMPIVPISHYSRNYLVHPAVRGWHPKLLDNRPWKSVHFEPAQ